MRHDDLSLRKSELRGWHFRGCLRSIPQSLPPALAWYGALELEGIGVTKDLLIG